MTALRVYVAASSAPDQMARAHAVSERLRKAGIELTSTWIASITAVGEANPRDASREQRAQWSDACLTGVEQADVVLLLVPPVTSPTRGAWVELGAVLMLIRLGEHKRVIASGDTKRTIFLGHRRVVEVDDDEQAIEWICDAFLAAMLNVGECPAQSNECAIRGRCTNKCGALDAKDADRAEMAAHLRADGGDPL